MFLFGLGLGLGAVIAALIIYVIWGALIGFVASKIMGAENEGFVMSAFLGIIGSILGGVIGNIFHVHSTIPALIFSLIGSCFVVWVVRKINHN
ncbi:MAG: GlsB/YeaQ/YmgE family stress response membrane protein [Oscillospiraceae bacterium]|nr:GlsB/YeaQ/YmgE family stress response membrane protein [Oscillospiraceae bacterium]